MLSSKIKWAAMTALVALSWAAMTSAEETVKASAPLMPADDTTRGGHQPQGHSQQYHYQSPGDGWVSSGISVDLTSGIVIAVGAIILLLAFAGIIYPLLSSKSGGSGWGWEGDSGASTGSNSYGGWSRSYNVAGTAEKVLNAVDKLYAAYSKHS